MKMLSQLTRQAISRHQLLSANPPVSPALPVQPSPPPLQPTGFQMIRPLYPGAAPEPASLPPAPPDRPAPPAPSPPPVRRHTVYQQLMSSHDRMTDRHLRRT